MKGVQTTLNFEIQNIYLQDLLARSSDIEVILLKEYYLSTMLPHMIVLFPWDYVQDFSEKTLVSKNMLPDPNFLNKYSQFMSYLPHFNIINNSTYYSSELIDMDTGRSELWWEYPLSTNLNEIESEKVSLHVVIK